MIPSKCESCGKKLSDFMGWLCNPTRGPYCRKCYKRLKTAEEDAMASVLTSDTATPHSAVQPTLTPDSPPDATYWPSCWPPPSSQTRPGDVDVVLDNGVTVQTFVRAPLPDSEVDALSTIVDALERLPSGTRLWFLSYLYDRYCEGGES